MTDLSPEARAIVEAGRSGGGQLSVAERDRIKRGALLRAATMGAAATTAGTAAAMSLASKVTLVAVATAVLGGGAVSVWAWSARTGAPAPAVAASLPPKSAVVPASTAAVAPKALPADASSSGAGISEAGRKPVRRSVAANAPYGGSAPALAARGVDSEIEVLRQARAELRQGLPERAFQRLAEYERGHGKGMLAQERWALSAIALCQWHPGPEAQARAAEFLRNTPESPLADRVHVACGPVGSGAK